MDGENSVHENRTKCETLQRQIESTYQPHNFTAICVQTFAQVSVFLCVWAHVAVCVYMLTGFVRLTVFGTKGCPRSQKALEGMTGQPLCTKHLQPPA